MVLPSNDFYAAESSSQRRLFGKSSSSSLLQSPRSPGSPGSSSLEDCRMYFSEFAEPAPKKDQKEEYVKLFGIHTLVRYPEKSVTVFPEDTPLDVSSISDELLKTDLGDVSGSALYDEVKKNGPALQKKAHIFYVALVAQSVRRKLRAMFELKRKITVLHHETKELLPFLDDSQLKKPLDTLERVSIVLSKMASADMTEEEVHDLEKDLLETSIKPLERLLLYHCILKPCNQALP